MQKTIWNCLHCNKIKCFITLNNHESKFFSTKISNNEKKRLVFCIKTRFRLNSVCVLSGWKCVDFLYCISSGVWNNCSRNVKNGSLNPKSIFISKRLRKKCFLNEFCIQNYIHSNPRESRNRVPFRILWKIYLFQEHLNFPWMANSRLRRKFANIKNWIRDKFSLFWTLIWIYVFNIIFNFSGHPTSVLVRPNCREFPRICGRIFAQDERRRIRNVTDEMFLKYDENCAAARKSFAFSRARKMRLCNGGKAPTAPAS